MNQFLNSPYFAMAGQAINNLSNMGMGGGTVSPVQAYQQAVADKQRQALERAKFQQRNRQLAVNEILAQAQLQKSLQPPKPSAFTEKVNASLAALGYDPENYDPGILATPEFQQQFEALGRGPLVDMGTQEQDAWRENMLKLNIEDYNAMRSDALRSADRENRLNTMLLYSNLFEGGGLVGDAFMDFKKNLSALGFDVDPATSAEQLFSALATQNQFERTALLKGAISEKELALAGLMDSTSRNTREGREYILNYRIAEARRAQEVFDAAQAWRERTGREYDEREFRKSDEYKAVREKPIVTSRLLELGRINHPQAFKDYVKNPETGEWFRIERDPDAGEVMVPLNIR